MRTGTFRLSVVALPVVSICVVLAGCEVSGIGVASPVFAAGTDTSREVAENTAAGTAIGQAFVATDADGDSVSYALEGTDAATFAIGAASGVLETSAALDYETKTSYAVTVRASDGGGNAAALAVTIAVTNVDEPGSVSFDSQAPAVDTALTASVADPDGGVSSVSWQWAKAATKAGSYADISGATGAAYTPAAGDAGAWLRATARYTDGHGSGKSAAGTAAAAVTGSENEPESPPVEPSIVAPTDLSRRTLWMDFQSTDVSACSGSTVYCSCNILDPTCTERNRTCERVAKSEYYLRMLSTRYIFDGEALRHPDEYLTRGGPHRVWKWWTYSHKGDRAALSISQPGWWFENGSKWVPMIDLVHRMAFSRRVEGLYPRYEGVLILQAEALQESCSLRISASFELFDN